MMIKNVRIKTDEKSKYDFEIEFVWSIQYAYSITCIYTHIYTYIYSIYYIVIITSNEIKSKMIICIYQVQVIS